MSLWQRRRDRARRRHSRCRELAVVRVPLPLVRTLESRRQEVRANTAILAAIAAVRDNTSVNYARFGQRTVSEPLQPPICAIGLESSGFSARCGTEPVVAMHRIWAEVPIGTRCRDIELADGRRRIWSTSIPLRRKTSIASAHSFR